MIPTLDKVLDVQLTPSPLTNPWHLRYFGSGGLPRQLARSSAPPFPRRIPRMPLAALLLACAPALPVQTTLLEIARESSPGAQVRPTIVSLGDVDADGVPDLAIADSYYSVLGHSNGRIQVFSGASGTELCPFRGGHMGHLGTGLVALDDVTIVAATFAVKRPTQRASPVI